MSVGGWRFEWRSLRVLRFYPNTSFFYRTHYCCSEEKLVVSKEYQSFPVIRLLRSVVGFLIFLTGAILLLIMTSSRSDIGPYFSAVQNWPLFVFACIVSLAEVVFVCLIPVCALYAVGQKCHLGAMVYVHAVATYSNSFFPFPASLPLRVMLQQKFMGLHPKISSAALLLEILWAYGLMFVTGFIATFFFVPSLLDFSRIAGFWEDADRIRRIVALCVAIVSVLLFSFVVYRVRGFVRRERKTLSEIKMTTNGILLLTSAVCIVIAIALFRFLLIVWSVGASVSPGIALSITTFSYLAGVASLLPAGLGVRDASLIGLLHMSGIPLTQAISIALYDRLLTLIPVILVAGIGIMRLRLKLST